MLIGESYRRDPVCFRLILLHAVTTNKLYCLAVKLSVSNFVAIKADYLPITSALKHENVSRMRLAVCYAK